MYLFSSLCVLTCLLKLPLYFVANPHSLHFFGFPMVCISMCAFNLPISREAKSHRLHLFGFHHCATINVSSNDMPEWMNSHIDHICAAFLLCVFSYDLSNEFSDAMQSYIACICTICFQNVFSCVFSNCSN